MDISTDSRFIESLTYIANKFDKPIKKIGERYSLLLPKSIDNLKLFDSIINQLITTMKAQYIKENLQIKHEILIRILTNYDKKTDMIIATSLVKLSPTMLLDAIFDFSISKLKYRWDEVIQLVNDNHLKLAQKELFNELLRFLIQNMDFKTKEAHILTINEQVTVCNEKLIPFERSDTNIINTLIDVAPRQIFIHMDDNLEKNLIKNIENIFPNCVTIQYANN